VEAMALSKAAAAMKERIVQITAKPMVVLCL
jgi:hypothetical protein